MAETASEIIGSIRSVSDSPGAAPLHAAVRQGADEIAQILPAFPANGVQPVSEMGQLFEPTPQQVSDQVRGDLPAMHELRAHADARKDEAPDNTDGQQRGRGR